MATEIKGGGQSQVFDYKQVDEQMAEFLRRKETIIWSAYETMIETVGGELKDAQERLAGSNQYDGVFEKWYTALGFTKQTVYNYISYHSVVKLVDEQKLKIDVEELPKKLVYAIGSQSSESTPAKAKAKSEVLAGDINTLKAYKERIAQLEKQADIERRERERLEEENEQLAKQADKPPEVKTEYVEVPIRDESVEQRLQAYEERFGAIENYSDRPRATNLAEVTTSVMSFSKAVRDLAKRHAYLIQYQSTIEALDATTKREYNEAVQALYDLSKDFGAVSEDTTVIDVEYEII